MSFMPREAAYFSSMKWNHNCLCTKELKYIVDTGGTFSIATAVEMQMRHGMPPIDRILRLAAWPSKRAITLWPRLHLLSLHFERNAAEHNSGGVGFILLELTSRFSAILFILLRAREKISRRKR